MCVYCKFDLNCTIEYENCTIVLLNKKIDFGQREYSSNRQKQLINHKNIFVMQMYVKLNILSSRVIYYWNNIYFYFTLYNYIIFVKTFCT